MIQENGKIKLQNWEIVSVNPSDKIWDWKDLFCFWGNNIQSIIGFSLIASLYLVYQLNIIVVFSGTIAAALLVVFFIIYLLLNAHDYLEYWGLFIIICGAIGNIIDRFVNGYVIDFIYFHINQYYWPAFNFADIYISAGIIMILLNLSLIHISEPTRPY